jgi:hypothetical protein
MLKVETSLEELEEKILSYESFKQVLQQYLQRLLGSDQDTLAVVAEMLAAVKRLSSERELAEAPIEIQRVLGLQPAALYRYGGVGFVEGVPAPPVLRGGVIKLDDPQVYGMSLISTWLDCIISNPEQSLDSLRKVFLRAGDPWGTELNRTFHLDLGRTQPIAAPEAWLADLLRGESIETLQLARVTNVAQALGLETPVSLGRVPLAVWRHLLQTRLVYDLTARFGRAGRDTARARLIALRREIRGQTAPSLYRLGLAPAPAIPLPPPPITLADLQATLGCTLATPVHLEMIERADHLSGSAPATWSASLPLGSLRQTFSLILNQPPGIILQDITPAPTPFAQRLLRVAAAPDPERAVRLFRIRPLAPDEWPSQRGWTRTYRFHDLSDIGVTTCPPEAYVEVALREAGPDEEEDSEIYFHRWGEKRASLRITAQGLHRTAQTGTLILVQADEDIALDILASLQGLIGPAAQEIDPLVSRLDCQVHWRPRPGPELFAT